MSSLSKQFGEIRKMTYFSYVVVFIDIICVFLFKDLLNNLINIVTIILYFLCFSYCMLVLFNTRVNNIDYTMKILLNRISLMTFFLCGAIYVDILYIIIIKILLDVDILYQTLTSGNIYDNFRNPNVPFPCSELCLLFPSQSSYTLLSH